MARTPRASAPLAEPAPVAAAEASPVAAALEPAAFTEEGLRKRSPVGMAAFDARADIEAGDTSADVVGLNVGASVADIVAEAFALPSPAPVRLASGDTFASARDESGPAGGTLLKRPGGVTEFRDRLPITVGIPCPEPGCERAAHPDTKPHLMTIQEPTFDEALAALIVRARELPNAEATIGYLTGAQRASAVGRARVRFDQAGRPVLA